MQDLPEGYQLIDEVATAPGTRVVRARSAAGVRVQIALVETARAPVPRDTLAGWARSFPANGVDAERVWVAVPDADDVDLLAGLRSLVATRVAAPRTVALEETIVGSPTGPKMDTAFGSELFAGFRIDGTLGQGGMGVVYRAWDPHLERPVAIKMVLSQFLGPEGKERFLSEARAASRINHPHVVTVYAAGEVDGNPYMAMELVEGENLRERMVREPVDWRQTLRWTADLLDGLAPLHEQGILHRDIKPDNVLVTRDGTVKLMDFGLAKGPGAVDPGGLVGTVFYMSPEQARSEEVTASTDVFSMGAMLYEMLSGELPFRGEDIQTVLDRVCNADPPPLQVEGDLPVEVELVVARALAKESGSRFSSAAEFRDAIREILDADARAAALNRRRWILGSIAAVVLLSVAGIWIGSRFIEPEVDRAWVEAFNELGIEQMEAGQLEEARAKYQATLLSDPAYALAWNNLGMIEMIRGDLAAADSLFTRATEEDPHYGAPWINRAILYEDSGQPAIAERYYRAAIDAEPDLGVAYNELGYLLMKLGRLEEAAGVLAAGRESVPPDDESRAYLARTSGRVALRLGDGEAALRFLAQARAQLPTGAWSELDTLEAEARALID